MHCQLSKGQSRPLCHEFSGFRYKVIKAETLKINRDIRGEIPSYLYVSFIGTYIHINLQLPSVGSPSLWVFCIRLNQLIQPGLDCST